MPAVPLQSLWSVTAPAGPVCRPLEEALHAQVAVIGAGYTGLSAALHLAERGREVVVLEAADIGARASGTNGGQVIPGVKHDPDTLERIFGHDAGSRLVATAAAGPDLVFELIAQHGIECDAVRRGWIQPAESDEALAELAGRVEQWRRRGAAVELLSREAVQRLTGSQHYRGGLLDRRGGTLQPLSYVRGLAAAALRVGARIFTESPALELTRSAHGWSIETPRGAVRAPLVIAATNAYTGPVCDALRRTVIPVPSFQVATAPIPTALRREILPEGQAASDTRRLCDIFVSMGAGASCSARAAPSRRPRACARCNATTGRCTRSIRSSQVCPSNTTGGDSWR